MVAWNDDVLLEILLRLPTKSLIRFKSVSKHWLSLISARHFCRLHAIHDSNSEHSLILRTHASHFFYLHPIFNRHKLVPYRFTDIIPDPKIVSSCNGLLLLRSNDHQENDCHVYNPTTRQSRMISLANDDKYTDVVGLNLAFDPSKSLRYKIVCIRATRRTFRFGHKRTYLIEVYDSERCTWRPSFTTNIEADFQSGVHWNDSMHWENHPAHLYLNMGKNFMRTLPHAVIPWRGGDGVGACRCHLHESNGRLYNLIIGSHLGDKSMAVYELQEDYSQWLLKYHGTFVDELRGMFSILSFMWGDDSWGLVTHVPGKISIYRFLDKSSEDLVDLMDQPFYQQDSLQFGSKDVYLFGETMAPV